MLKTIFHVDNLLLVFGDDVAFNFDKDRLVRTGGLYGSKCPTFPAGTVCG